MVNSIESEDTLSAAASLGTDGASEEVESFVSLVDTTNAHVVFLLVDDQGFNDIGYNTLDLWDASPTIDWMAEQGIKLDNYYAQHLCTPSRAALMTGMLPYHMGMQHEVILPSAPWGVPLKHQMLPQYLDTLGYDSHMVGKWHLGFVMDEYLPTARGFDSFYGFLADQENYYDRQYPYPIGGDDLYFKDWMDAQAGVGFDFIGMTGNYSLDLIVDRAEDLLSNHNTDVPLFLYVSFQTLHGPLEAPPDHMVSDKQILRLNEIPNEERKKFARMLMATDYAIKRITDAVSSAGMDDNTVYIYSSDNGACHLAGGYNAPLRGGKHYLWEGGIRVHSFIYSSMFAGTTLKGSRYPGLMHISDWVPTIMHMVSNVSMVPQELDGVSQWPALQMQQKPPRQILVHNVDRWVTMQNGTKEWLAPLDQSRGALRVGDMKLITNEFILPWYSPHEPDEDDEDGSMAKEFQFIQDCEHAPNTGIATFLFNISADPYEQHDLSLDHPEMVVELSQLLNSLASRMEEPRWMAEDSTAVETWIGANNYFCPWLNWNGTTDDLQSAKPDDNTTVPPTGSDGNAEDEVGSEASASGYKRAQSGAKTGSKKTHTAHKKTSKDATATTTTTGTGSKSKKTRHGEA